MKRYASSAIDNDVKNTEAAAPIATNEELNIVDPKIAEKTAQEWENYPVNMGQQYFDEIKKILDMEDISYRN